MLLFTESTAFRIIDSVAIVLAQAYQLARARAVACACRRKAVYSSACKSRPGIY